MNVLTKKACRLAVVLAAAACALAVTAGPASAKHCQDCWAQDGTPLAGSDVTRGQLALDAAAGTALTWVRKTS
jgi:hypothetical protein